MSNIVLEAKARNTKAKARDLRKQGIVPGVLYGFNTENQTVMFDDRDFHKVYVKAGESTIIDINVDGKTSSVLIHKVDCDPVTDKYEHIDFFAPDMTKEITTHIQIRAIGEATGVKDHGGVLITHRDSIEVRCLPKDLPHDIPVDLSALKEIQDSISIKDLKVSSAVSVLLDDDELLFVVEAPRKEEEIVPATGEEGTEDEGGEKKEGEDEGGEEKKENKEEAKKK